MSETIFCPICGQKLLLSKTGIYWDDYYFFHDGHKITVKIYRAHTKVCQIPISVEKDGKKAKA
jgi:hypothetical protein